MIVGEPGSGKSYYAVRRMLEVIVHLRRPVWTNLPLRWRVVRQYLTTRGGSQLASLIHPLTRGHFERFLSRFRARQSYVDEQRTGKGLSRRQAAASWIQHAGGDVWDGPTANWVPFGALIIVDECHHWTPNAAVRMSERESEDLLPFFTMHRHGSYWVWGITQAMRQVSQTWRSLTTEVHHVVNAGMRPMLLGVTPSHVGVRCLLRSSYSREAWNEGVPTMPPHERLLFFPSAPWRRWIFRLYDSFSHVASAREISESVEAVRCAAGVSPVRASHQEVRPMKRSMLKSALVLCALAAGGAIVFYGVSKLANRILHPGAEAAAKRVPAVEEPPKVVPPSLVLRGVVGGRMVGSKAGEYYAVGDECEGGIVTMVDPHAALGYVRRPDGVHWVYSVGAGARRLGTDEEIERLGRAVQARIAASRGVAGPERVTDGVGSAK